MLAPVVRGGAAGVRALLKRAHGRGVRGSLANAAERFLRRQVELEDASPFDAAPAATAGHRKPDPFRKIGRALGSFLARVACMRAI